MAMPTLRQTVAHDGLTTEMTDGGQLVLQADQNGSAPFGPANCSAAESFDTEHRDFPICPHCGAEDKDAWMEFCDRGQNLECFQCGMVFHVERNVTVTFTTSKLNDRTEPPDN